MRRACAASSGISTPTVRSASSRPGSKANPTIPSRRARSLRRRHASCWLRLAFAPLSATCPAPSISRIIPTCRLRSRLQRAAPCWGRSCSKAAARLPVAIPAQTVSVEGLGIVKIELADELLTVSLDDGASVKCDVADAMREVYRRGWPKVDDHRPIELKGTPNDLDGTAVIDNINGTYKKPDFDISLLRFWLVLSKSG